MSYFLFYTCGEECILIVHWCPNKHPQLSPTQDSLSQDCIGHYSNERSLIAINVHNHSQYRPTSTWTTPNNYSPWLHKRIYIIRNQFITLITKQPNPPRLFSTTFPSLPQVLLVFASTSHNTSPISGSSWQLQLLITTSQQHCSLLVLIHSQLSAWSLSL